MGKTKVVVIDDAKDMCDSTRNYFKNNSTYEIVGIAHNGKEGIKVIKECLPHIVILDMVMPDSDGMYVLRALQEENWERKPIVLVVSAIAMDIPSRIWMENGADYVLAKETKPKNIEFHMDLLMEMASSHTAPAVPAAKAFKQSVDPEAMATEMINDIGIPANRKGYEYTRCAVVLCAKDPTLLNFVTKHLYTRVAELCNTTPDKVERNIRSAIEIAWDRIDPQTCIRTFGATVSAQRGRPTNSEFIAMLADRIHLAMKNG